MKNNGIKFDREFNNYRLSSIDLENFKSIKKSSVVLAPLTVLLGANATGKSSLIQSILLLAQNMQRTSNPFNLLLNGPGVRLGSFGNVLRHESKKPFVVQLGVEAKDSYGTEGTRNEYVRIESRSADSNTGIAPISLMAYFGNNEKGSNWFTEITPVAKSMQNKRSTATYVSVTCHSSFNKLSSPADGQLYAVIQEEHPFQIVPIEDSEYLFPGQLLDWFVRYTYRNVRLFSDLFNERKSIQEMRQDLENFTEEVKSLLIKNEISERYESKGFQLAEQKITEWLDAIDELIADMKDADPLTIGFQITSYLESVVSEIRHVKEEDFGSRDELQASIKYAISSKRRKWFTSRYPLGVTFGDDMRPNTHMSTVLMDYLATNMHYLGPLRADPGSIQQLDSVPSALTPLGSKGEYLAFQLKSGEFALKKQKLPLPEGEVDDALTLTQALSKWIQFLGLGSKVDLVESGPLGFTILVDDVPVFATGTGISQVLPVLTICLLAKPGSVVLIEQPELHLHPGSQRKLADFFLRMIESGRNIIVETHSEYLLNRLRHAVAVSGKPSDLISVVFTESVKDGKRLQTVFRQASIQETGDLSSWPIGFFDFSDIDNLEIMIKNFQD